WQYRTHWRPACPPTSRSVRFAFSAVPLLRPLRRPLSGLRGVPRKLRRFLPLGVSLQPMTYLGLGQHKSSTREREIGKFESTTGLRCALYTTHLHIGVGSTH